MYKQCRRELFFTTRFTLFDSCQNHKCQENPSLYQRLHCIHFIIDHYDCQILSHVQQLANSLHSVSIEWYDCLDNHKYKHPSDHQVDSINFHFLLTFIGLKEIRRSKNYRIKISPILRVKQIKLSVEKWRNDNWFPAEKENIVTICCTMVESFNSNKSVWVE